MTTKTSEAHARALAHIQLAMENLSAAASISCDLQGWSEEWKAIGDAYDAAHALWHRCNDAPLPLGHDFEKP